jgi:hypothetical protein
VGHNVQIVVDVKHKPIIEQQVTNQIVGIGLLTETAKLAKEVLAVETIEAVADKGTSRSRTSKPARSIRGSGAKAPSASPAAPALSA